MKASTLKLVAVIAVSIAALAVLLNMIPTYQPTSASLMYTDTVKYTYSGVKTNDDRLAFLSQFGWEVEPTPEEQNVTIPGEFDRVFVSYNELQKQQGLDLSKYKRQSDRRRYLHGGRFGLCPGLRRQGQASVNRSFGISIASERENE